MANNEEWHKPLHQSLFSSSSCSSKISGMVLKSREGGGGYHEPPAKPDHGWRLNFENFSWLWFIIICWCTILLGFLVLWFIGRAWRCRRARRIMNHLGATTYPPSGGQEFNDSCPICITEFAQDEEVVLLRCGHTYKASCLRKQLEAGFLQCAVCRAKLE